MPQWENSLNNQYEALKNMLRKNIKKFKNMNSLQLDVQFIINLNREDFIDYEIESKRAVLEQLYNIDGIDDA